MSIENKIQRLAELNAAQMLVPLAENLKEERLGIFNDLKELGVVKKDNDKGGFSFIGDKANYYKREYLDAFENF